MSCDFELRVGSKEGLSPPPPIEFLCLEKSNNITDRLIYITTIDLLNNITIRARDLLPPLIETNNQKQYVFDNWETLSSLFQYGHVGDHMTPLPVD